MQATGRHAGTITQSGVRAREVGAAVACDGPGAPDKDLDDAALLERIAAGESAALEALYDRHSRAAYALARWLVGGAEQAEDVVQDAFLAVWRQAASFDSRRGSPQAWLYTIVRHRAIDLLRRTKSQCTAIDDLAAENIVDTRHDVEAEVTLNAQRATVRGAILRLPPAQRRAIELAYFQGLTHHEIAARLCLPLGTVKGRLRIALQKLRVVLAAEHASAAAS
jgi:RNA polymerase sigma-70 factor (ECF subfamily)